MGQICAFNSFVGGTKLGGVADSLWSHAAIHREFDRMENWTSRNLGSSTRSGGVLHPERSNPSAPIYPGDHLVESILAEKDFRGKSGWT